MLAALAAPLARVCGWCGGRGAVALVALGLAGGLLLVGRCQLGLGLGLVGVRWSGPAAVVDIDVDAAFGVLLEGLVVVPWFWEFGDHVPGMDEAGELNHVSRKFGEGE